MQSDIIKNPQIGDLIVGTGGLRKVRLAGSATGKSSGYRIIYLLVLPDIVHLMLLYKKGRKESLTQQEKNKLKAISKSIKRNTKMKDSIFDELYASMKEAELIAKGELKPAKVTRYEVADVKAIRSQLDVSQKCMVRLLIATTIN
ncbi:MAG: hypothetical protein ACK5NC_01825 [Vibrio sp.]